MATQRFVSATNSYLPIATGQVIGYTRDPKEFPLNKYVQLIEAPAPVFVYAILDHDQAVRAVNEAEFAWEDGDKRPTGHHNLSRFKWEEGRCYRRDFPWTLGMQAVNTAKKNGAFDPTVVESKNVASQAMTFRTNRVITLTDTAANWPSTNTSPANTLNGGAGKWDVASNDPTDPGYLAIKKTLMAAVRRIHLSTNGKVKLKDMVLVLSPESAISMANTSEIHDYVKHVAGPKVVQEGGLANPNEMWGLPATLYGIEVVIEDSPKVTVYPKADGSIASIALSERTYIKSSDSAMLCSRPGGIDAPYGAPSFSTIQLYWYEYEMKVESKDDTWNQLVEGHVVEQFKEVLAATLSGFLITDILS